MQARTPYSYIAAASANQDSNVVKATPGNIGTMLLCNAVASIRYVKLYDKATAPTSADTPVQRYALQASQTLPIDFGTGGLTFLKGIAFRLTTGEADTDASAVSASDVIVNLDYL